MYSIGVQPRSVHQARDGAAGHRMALAAELLPDLPHAVDFLVLLPPPTEVIANDLILAHAARTPLGTRSRSRCS